MNGFGSILKDYLEYFKISQTDFADQLGISQKHLNQICNGNSNISLDLMLAISLITDINVNTIVLAEQQKQMYNFLHTKYKTDKEIKHFLDGYCLKDMCERKWIQLHDKTSNVQNALDLLKFMGIKDFDLVDKYCDNKIMYKTKSDASLTKICLWTRRCDYLIEHQSVSEYKSSNLNTLLVELNQEQVKPFNSQNLITLFNKYGIYLAIEDALKGTKVRGCMQVKKTNPAIYMTKYYKDKASFYYTLYHEIGHIKTDYNRAKNKIIIDDEEEMDNYSLDQMMPPTIWNEILTSDNKEEICKKNNIPLCFLYSRMSYEKLISYKEYNKYKEII